MGLAEYWPPLVGLVLKTSLPCILSVHCPLPKEIPAIGKINIFIKIPVTSEQIMEL